MPHSRRSVNGAGLGDTLFKLLNPTGLTQDPPMFEKEHHAKGYNYLGDSTQLQMREKAGVPFNQPINALDASAKKHDYAYASAKTIQDIHQADDEFIEDLKKIPNFSLTKLIASKAIMLKKWAEKAGILDPKEFSMSGIGLVKKGENMLGELIDPAYKLKMSMNSNKKKQIGGFAQLLPFLVPLIIEYAPKLAEFAYNKIKGNGMDARDLLDYVGSLKPEKQMDFVISSLIKK